MNLEPNKAHPTLDAFTGGSKSRKNTHKIRILDEIGRGVFGKVLRVEDIDTGELNALKVIKNERYLPNELKILKLLKQLNGHHYHCVNLLHYYHTNSERLLQFPLYGPTLLTILKKHCRNGLAIPEVYKIAKQICKGVRFLQENGIVHADLKLDNIIFVHKEITQDYDEDGRMHYIRMVNPSIVLIDFGQAFMHPDRFDHFDDVCCITYRPPESHLKLAVSYPVDVWCVGLICFAMYHGRSLLKFGSQSEILAQLEKIFGPFPERLTKLEMGVKLFSNGYVIKPEKFDHSKLLNVHEFYIYRKSTTGLSYNFFKFMEGLLQIDPQKRLSMKNVMKNENW